MWAENNRYKQTRKDNKDKKADMNKQKQEKEDKGRREQARKEVKRHLKNKNRQNN